MGRVPPTPVTLDCSRSAPAQREIVRSMAIAGHQILPLISRSADVRSHLVKNSTCGGNSRLTHSFQVPYFLTGLAQRHAISQHKASLPQQTGHQNAT